MKTVLYIAYSNPDYIASGSGVRPKRILDAFLQEGYNVKSFYEEQMRDNFPQRKKDIKELKQWISHNDVDFCYIESSTYPILLRADRQLIRYITRKGIPTGYFYRDFYFKFPSLLKKEKGLVRWLKSKYLVLIQLITDKTLKVCDVVYFPSDECSKLFNYKKMLALPPAGEDKIINNKQLHKTCVYVGGITEFYDGKLLFDAFTLLNKEDNIYKLILVCREEEWKNFQHDQKEAAWVEVHHASGAELEQYYKRADIGLIIHANNEYNQLAIPVKTFEYISRGLPVVSVDIKALASFIRDEEIGIVTDHTDNSLADGINRILDEKELSLYRENVKKALLTRHLWKHRIQQIDSNLKKGIYD